MVLGRLSRRAVAPHGDAGEPDPLPQLFDVARRARLAVQSGDDEGPSPIIHGVVQSRSFDQIVVEGRGEGAMGQVDVHAALQRGDMQSDAVERLHEILAPCAWFLVPAANRISMPTSRPTDRDTITPVTELIDSRIRMADEM